MPSSQVLDIEWERFNALKSFIVEFVSTGNGGSPFFNQTGTQIKENKMVLQLLQLLFHLIQGGFYPAKDLVEVLPTLIQLLDGRDGRLDRAATVLIRAASAACALGANAQLLWRRPKLPHELLLLLLLLLLAVAALDGDGGARLALDQPNSLADARPFEQPLVRA